MADQLVLQKQTPFQRIELFEEIGTGKVTLALDGYIQLFEGEDERLYHENLTKHAFELKHDAKEFLILGGGDGCVAREILKFNPKAEITLVDIDEEVVKLSMNDERLVRINQGSLKHCKLYFEDALVWVPKQNNKYFDIIILDFPDANTKELKKLYQEEFLSQVVKLLKKGGVISIQSGFNFWKLCMTLDKLLGNFKIVKYTMPTLGQGVVILGRNE